MPESLYERVLNRVRFPLWKHRDEDVTNDDIDRQARQIVDAWSPLELLSAISLELEEMQGG